LTKYYYKIRRKSDGLYSKGGMNPYFTRIGKVWKTAGHLVAHLKLVYLDDYANCEVVRYSVVEDGIEDIGNFI
jgi:hypothetical protein